MSVVYLQRKQAPFLQVVEMVAELTLYHLMNIYSVLSVCHNSSVSSLKVGSQDCSVPYLTLVTLLKNSLKMRLN